MGSVFVSENADEVRAERVRIRWFTSLVRPRLGARLRHRDVGKIDSVAGAEPGLRNVQGEARPVIPATVALSRHAALPCETIFYIGDILF
jgi:hypothetical protein